MELGSHQSIMRFKQRAPMLVSLDNSALCGTNDVGEHDRRENSVGLDLGPFTR